MSARQKSAPLLAAGLVAAALIGVPAETATAAPFVTPINSAVGVPYNLAAYKSTVVVADGGTSPDAQNPLAPRVARLLANGNLTTLAAGPQPGEVAGVAFSRDGKSYAYTSSEYVGGGTGPEPPQLANGSLTIVRPNKAPLVVNLAAYEKKKNPDAQVSYGLKNAPPCLVSALGQDASYKGRVDSHPYSVDAYKGSSWVVADAAGNDLLRVSKKGKVSTLAVLPRQRLTITPEVAESEKIPSSCDVIGKSFYTEAVPTDVEYDDGYFWVSVLPGGPETGAARGKIYRVSKNGKVKEVASGLAGATNLERHNGKIYVAELFYGSPPALGRISVIKGGKPKTYVTLPGALSVEWANGHLLAGTGVTGPASIVRIG